MNLPSFQNAILTVALAVLLSISLAPSTHSANMPTFDAPHQPSRNLVLEDLCRPGSTVDISTYYGKDGKPILLAGICPE